MKNRPTLTKEEYEKWATEAGSRVIGLSQVGPIRVSSDGKMLAIFDFTGIISPDPDWNGTTINLRETGLRLREGLVGIAGAYYDASMVGAKSVEEVMDSWNWLFGQFKSDKTELE